MNSNKDIYTVSIDNEIQYIITDACNVLFILGPISTNPSNKLVCYKPATCFEYIECMLCKIIENNLIYDVNSRSYNIYVRKAIHYIHKYYHEDISIDDLCEKLNINKSYFCNLFKKSTSQTFSNFLNYFRVEKSKKLLEDPKLSLLEVALDVGFTNQNYYTIVFKKITKQTPSAYRKAMVSLKNQVY
ncbi:AraC family transcriptional regulator [Terrisporobacter glycolicus]|nr:AraC family transcriptional regulator [Terrisporobacter glycolicus]